jgi:hypothetical protein
MSAAVVFGLHPGDKQPVELQQRGGVIDPGGGKVLAAGIGHLHQELLTHAAEPAFDLASSLRGAGPVVNAPGTHRVSRTPAAATSPRPSQTTLGSPPADQRPGAATPAQWPPSPEPPRRSGDAPPAGTRTQRSPNPFRRIRSAQQHGHRQQDVRHRARSATGPPRRNRIRQPRDPAGTGITPPAQHATATRAPNLPGSQPGLDAGKIDLYRHHRCLRALQRGTPQAGQDFSGVPRTHQFLVTLTVHTHKINSATSRLTTSATSLTETTPMVVVPRDAQHANASQTGWQYTTSLTYRPLALVTLHRTLLLFRVGCGRMTCSIAPIAQYIHWHKD